MKKLLLLLLIPILAFTQDSWINIDIHTDDWPEETSWELLDSNDSIIATGGPYEDVYTLYSELIELNSGDYYYFLFDSYGDGLWTGGYAEISNTCDGILFYHEGPFSDYTIEDVIDAYNNGDDIEWMENELLESLTIAPCAPPTEGCTDPEANNYDETAFFDDDSCEYNYGCNNENASNYDSLAVLLPQGPIVPGGSCNLEVWTQNYFGVDSTWYFDGNQSTFAVGNKLYIGENTFWVDVVSEYQGNCNSPAVLVYVVTTPEAADGSAGTYTPGTNVNAVVGDYWYMDPCTFIYGCTQEDALNYNPEAGVDNGSCINIPGCTDPASINYNPAATLDDGTCGGGDILCSEGKTLLTVEIMVDNYPGETSWQIYDNAENLIDEAPQGFYDGQPMGTIVEKQVCVDDNTDIIFFLSDSYGDGLGGAQWGGIDGTWLVYTECGDTISQGQGDFGSLWIDVGTVVPCAPETVEGCTDDDYLEFDPFANTDDGSCVTEKIYDCVDPDAFNYNPDATAQLENPNCINTLKLYDWADNGWAGSFMVVTQGDDYWGPFTLESDQLTFETEIDLNTDEMVKAYFYSFGQSQQTTEQCRFEIVNPIGDVILEGGTNPYINPILSYNQYGFSYQGQALCGDNCIPKVYGCLDSEAVNYNESANTTDNSCYYNPGCTDAAYIEYYDYIANNGIEADFDNGTCEVYAIFGCIDETAFNYNELATVNQVAVEDETDPCIPTILGCTDPLAFNFNSEANTLEPGSCIPVVNGCTDSTSFNYDSTANTDNGSCIAVVEGCTDSIALNYNSDANIDDGSCIPFIYGCTDSEAFNYDEDANTDNGSCVEIIEGCTNTLAYNYNQEANVNDGSCILTVYGCMDSDAFNYNEDANVDNGTCEAIVEGCTDSSATNYNSTANTEDFSCVYPIYGCTDETAFNYDEDANTDNDSCVPVVEGCTNILSVNYNIDANTDDGSCVLIVYGCTDSTAFNYNEDANTDNDSCIAVVEGCTDPSALNYNSEANTEDFSCIAVVNGCTDSEAFNYDADANTDNGSCIPVVEGCTNVLAVNYNADANTDDGTCELIVYGCTDETASNYN